MPARIRKDDMVQVIAGSKKGAVGKVLAVMADSERVLIEGVNLRYRHIRRSQANPQGGRVQKEAPIHMSNVQPIDPATGRGTRVRYKSETDAKGHVTRKQRVARSGKVIGEVTRSKKAGS